MRVCARPAGSWTAVAARDQDRLLEQRESLALAALLAVITTSCLGALSALAVARTVVQPLWRLRAAVQDVREEDPGACELGADEQVLEVDALRATLRAAFTKLTGALLQARRFASDAAHELRTPLTVVLGELELLREHARPEDRPGILRAHGWPHGSRRWWSGS